MPFDVLGDCRNLGAVLDSIPFNTFFARMVTDGRIRGKVYCDDASRPSSFLICHPYGMLLLSGRTDNEDFNAALKDFMLDNGSDRTLWLQAYPDNWHDRIATLLGDHLKSFDGEQDIGAQLRDCVVQFRRLNFRFGREKYLAQPKLGVPDGFTLVPTDRELFDGFSGTVVAKYFWDRPEDFISHGKGFAILEGEKIASASFSAFMIENFLEIGIETAEPYRGRGFAEIVCRALIDYALDNGLEPVWSCRGDNIGSRKLAEKLGFEVSLDIPYYGLRKR